MSTDDTVFYRAKSVLTSKTIIFNVLAGLVAFFGTDQIRTMLGPQALEYVAAFMAFANLALRVATVRPVALVKPGDSRPVQVAKL